MSRPVHWSTHATEHLAAIARYIGRTSPVYAERMVDRLLARTAQLSEFPDSGRHVAEASDQQLRELLEGAYRIIYLVQAAASTFSPSSTVARTFAGRSESVGLRALSSRRDR